MMKRNYLIAGLMVLCLCISGCGNRQASVPSPTTEQTIPSSPASVEDVPNNTKILLSSAEPVAKFTTVKQENYGNGTYYRLDTTADDQIRCISSCYRTSIRDDETAEDYAKRCAFGLSAALSPDIPYQETVILNQEMTDALGTPVYLVGFFTGSEPNAVCWMVYLTQTEHYSYQYAFASAPIQADALEDTYIDFFSTLKLEDMPQP